MKKRTGIALFMAIALLMTGCGNSSKENAKSNSQPSVTDNSQQASTKDSGSRETAKGNGGLMVLGVGSDPNIVNPLYANDRVSLTICNTLFDNVYNVKKGEIIYDGLAESMTASDDNLTYTLKLKENIKWHDGKDLTADDLIFTYDTVLDEKQRTKGQENLKNGGKPIAYKKIDDRTVEFKLDKVDATFVQNISSIVPVAKHVFEGEADIAKSPANQAPIGNGAFKFKEHKTGELYQVERNDNYYGDVAKLDGIAYKVIPDANAQKVALENGEISISYIKSIDVEKFKNNEKFNVVSFSEGMVNTLFFRVTNPKLEDKRVRQAISYAIDKEKLIQGAYNGKEYAKEAYSPFSDQTQYYTEDVEKYEHNVEKAKELLKQANVSDLNLRLMYTSGNPAQEKEALLIQEMLKDADIKIELLPMERGTFIEKLLDAKNQDFEMALNGYVMGDNPDNYSAIFKTGVSENFAGYSNKEVDKLFEEGKSETDDAKRAEIYKKIQQILTDDAVQYSTVNVKSILAVNKEFGNIEEANPAPIHMLDYFNKVVKVQ